MSSLSHQFRRLWSYGYLPNRKQNITAGTKLYCFLVTEAHVCGQLAQGRYMKVHGTAESRTCELLAASRMQVQVL